MNEQKFIVETIDFVDSKGVLPEWCKHSVSARTRRRRLKIAKPTQNSKPPAQNAAKKGSLALRALRISTNGIACKSQNVTTAALRKMS